MTYGVDKINLFDKLICSISSFSLNENLSTQNIMRKEVFDKEDIVSSFFLGKFLHVNSNNNFPNCSEDISSKLLCEFNNNYSSLGVLPKTSYLCSKSNQ